MMEFFSFAEVGLLMGIFIRLGKIEEGLSGLETAVGKLKLTVKTQGAKIVKLERKKA